MRHLDLFSGIGGFAIAVDTVWPGSEHVFCDNDKFCQAVLKKHWPQSKIYGDIRALRADGLSADTNGDGRPSDKEINANKTYEQTFNATEECGGQIDILTGGFPCQPFSQAGRRKGTDDDRYLWPEMLRVIREFQPTWVIAENVRGLLTLQQGVVFEQVCLDLEASGYEVQPLVIPAVAVNAPHRRDRIWFIANYMGARLEKEGSEQQTAGYRGKNSDTSNTESWESWKQTEWKGRKNSPGGNWERNWLEVASELCSLDDGLPVELGGLKLTKAGNRNAQLKAYGNAIVPQVAIEIMRQIKNAQEKNQ